MQKRLQFTPTISNSSRRPPIDLCHRPTAFDCLRSSAGPLEGSDVRIIVVVEADQADLFHRTFNVFGFVSSKYSSRWAASSI